MILRALTLNDKSEAITAHRELHLDNFSFLLDSKGEFDENASWSDYLQRIEDSRLGINLPENRVPATFFVAEVEGLLIGRVSIRHKLNEYLMERGGHIGYGIRPAFRRRGYATQICAMALDYSRTLGIQRALITCNEGNAGSQLAIERNGGVYENTFIEENGNKVSRYWVTN